MATLIRQATAKWYTGKIVLEDVQVEGPTSIVLKNFQFQTADGKETILALPTVRVEVAVSRFFRGLKAVEAITFEEPKLSLKRDSSGRLILQKYVRGRKRRKPKASPKPAGAGAEASCSKRSPSPKLWRKLRSKAGSRPRGRPRSKPSRGAGRFSAPGGDAR